MCVCFIQEIQNNFNYISVGNSSESPRIMSVHELNTQKNVGEVLALKHNAQKEF